MPRRTTRTYHDPLHGAITLDAHDSTEALLIQLIDTPQFQRLRRIRQLGPASLTFHGAETSRFTHSLGVMAIARRAFDQLTLHYPELAEYRPTVLAAALLHDIGHGPFSHTAEEIFGSQHEYWTQRIIHDAEAVRSSLDAFSPELATQIALVYQHEHPVPLVWQLVSSQLDCDRLDYLLRDSYFTGASYGRLDLDRILMAIDYDPHSRQLVVAGKGLAAIEHYLVVRYFMYAQVYNHPKNLAATWVLYQAIARARECLHNGALWADETVQAWLTYSPQAPLSLNHYLQADDMVLMYHLARWQTNPDPILADLCQRFLSRRLLKAWDITACSDPQQALILATIQAELHRLGFAAEYYCGLRQTYSRGYTLYQRGIKLLAPHGLQEINQLSPLVQTLISPYHRSWLLYPAEIETVVRELATHYTIGSTTS